MSSQPQKKQKKTNAKKVVSAPRRQGYSKKNRQNKKKNAAAVPGKVNVKGIKNADNVVFQRAQGDRTTIMVDVSVDPVAVSCFPLAFLSVAMSMGFANSVSNPIYAAYFARLSDLLLIMRGMTPAVPSRLQFENLIDASFIPKSIRLKTGTIATKWLGLDSVISNAEITVRGFTYYMYVDNGTYAGSWKNQVSPPALTLVESSPILAQVYNFIASDLIPHLRYVTNLDLLPEYKYDISGFGAASAYYGGGSSIVGAPCKSAEWEVPVKAPILATMARFGSADLRVARHLKITGGDSTFINGVALFPSFTPDTYKTKINPVFCFIDLDEVVHWLLDWYAALVIQVQKNSNSYNNSGEPLPCFTQFPYTAQAFRIAVRQTILALFVQSQAAGQFMTYTTNLRGFEPLRVGSNCYSQNRNTMTGPLLLIENVRMLMPRFLEMTGKLARSHNKQIYCPVWGVYKNLNFTPYNPTTQLAFEGGWNQLPLFDQDIVPEDPGVIDGVNTLGNPVNINSSVVNEIIADWNDRIEQLTTASTVTGYFGGSSQVSLLGYTRYAHYKEVETPIPLSQLTRLQKKYIDKRYVETRKIQRSTSRKEFDEVQVYIPPNGDLSTQYTVSYSSIFTITETAKDLLNYFIAPCCVIETDPVSAPTIRQLRTANLQSHILEYTLPDEIFTVDSRAMKLKDLGTRCAPGIAAGKNDELTNILQAFSNESKGGFFGSLAGALFPEIAPITQLLPF